MPIKDLEKRKESQRKYYERNAENLKIKAKIRQEENKDVIKERKAKYYTENKERIKLETKKYYWKNKEKIKQRKRKCRPEINEQRREKYNTDPEFRTRMLLSSRTNTAIKKGYKSGTTEELLGCSWEHVRKHIESQFTEGMSWENHGLFGWHIDHIKPCDSFDLTDPEEQKKCFHYTNLQPLWAPENLEKGASWEEDYFEDLFE